MEDNSIRTFFLFHLYFRIDLVEVVYSLKFKLVLYLLSKLCDKSVTLAEPLLFLNMIDIRTLCLGGGVVVVVVSTPSRT